MLQIREKNIQLGKDSFVKILASDLVIILETQEERYNKTNLEDRRVL